MIQERERKRAIAGPAVEPHLGALLPGDHPKSVMLDFVQSLAAGRQFRCFHGKARRDEPGREGALQHGD
jgi:hypothetical protein